MHVFNVKIKLKNFTIMLNSKQRVISQLLFFMKN